MQSRLRCSELALRNSRNGLKLRPQAPEGCAPRRFSCRCRIRRRDGRAGAPEALLGGGLGGSSPGRL
eukprot:10789109-Alexandrium_andersonii.AAC.1